MGTGSSYRGRFAPSPTGPLHAGSLVAALASWLDARAHNGTWLVRIEDVDTPRCQPETGSFILQQLASLGLLPDQPPVWQSRRQHLYQKALRQLQDTGLAYPCTCTRKEIADALAARGTPRERNAELVYPGTCRPDVKGQEALKSHESQKKNNGPSALEGRAWRFRSTPGKLTQWVDRRLGPQVQDVAQSVGDFVLLRSDSCYAYQLAVVVDDADQGITHIVRGSDLCDNTARQIALQQALKLHTPHYLHTPLVYGATGEKLSKQNGAAALDLSSGARCAEHLRQAARELGLRANTSDSDLYSESRETGETRETRETGTFQNGDNIAFDLCAWVSEWRDKWGNKLSQSPMRTLSP